MPAQPPSANRRSPAGPRAAPARRVFRDRQLDEIAFPLGGIGTGCVSLGGWGQLRDWEIYGRPGKGNPNDMAFFAVHVKGRPSVTRVLQGPAGGSSVGAPGPDPRASGGTGSWGRGRAAGLPHFRRCAFTGSYPFAALALSDASFPLSASLSAWNPFIPLNDRDSSIPCAIFEWTFRNRTDGKVEGVLFANLSNTIGYPDVGKGRCAFARRGGAAGIEMTTGKHAPGNPRHGTMALLTSHAGVTYLNHWLRSAWFDALTDFWDMAFAGRLDESVAADPSGEAAVDTSSIGLTFSLAPGASCTLPVVIAWHFPVTEMYWAPADAEGKRPTWTTWYATQWKDAWAAGEYALSNLPRLREETALYEKTLRSSTLPGHVIEAVTSTSSILKSPTCLRLSGGEVWAWEGCNDAAGCCDGTCTHVWNYQQMLPYLFPRLERGIRETDYANNLHEDGHMSFRMPLPLGTPGSTLFHAAADGQLGGILKVYRDWRICGDDAWLRRLWPSVKRSLQFAWVRWDRDRDGVIEGIQHNTYDVEFWGPNTMCGSFYLAALRAGEEMARRLGETDFAARCRTVYESGRAWTEANLWNGEYYVQKVDPEADRGDLLAGSGLQGPAQRPGTRGRPKYQYGDGCLSDQLLGQLYAEMLELGDIYESRHIDKAAESIFRFNWRTDFFDHANPQRVYAQDDEQGLLLCTWPRGNKEKFPFPYSDEVWTGIEYAAAALMAYRGRVDDCLSVVKGVRNRHDGTRRNPWDEFECGHHYARAMASYSVLLALSGFAADLPHKRIAFHPRINEKAFSCFFSVDSGWGLYSQAAGKGKTTYRVNVRYGALSLGTLSVSAPAARGGAGRGRGHQARATLGGRPLECAVRKSEKGMDLVLPGAVEVTPRAGLEIVVG